MAARKNKGTRSLSHREMISRIARYVAEYQDAACCDGVRLTGPVDFAAFLVERLPQLEAHSESQQIASSANTSGANGLVTSGKPSNSFAMTQYSPIPLGVGRLWGSNDGRNWTLIESSAV